MRIRSRRDEKTISGIRSCVRCGFFSEADQCAICTDPGRDTHSLCVVEQPTDILSLERSGVFRGLIIPLEEGCRRWIRLVPRIFGSIRWCAGKENQLQEVIFALSLDVEGEATLSYLGELLNRRSQRYADRPGVAGRMGWRPRTN